MKNILTRKFLCCYPLENFNWKEITKNITWEKQKTILKETIDHHLNQLTPVRSSYQIKFLKILLNYLEQQTVEVFDVFYEKLCDLQQIEHTAEKYSFKHFFLPNNSTVTLEESNLFVKNGTTGLCTWQAAIALSEWLIRNPEIVQNKTIIELGAGTGLCGIISVKFCKAKKIIITDGSLKVLEILEKNLLRNFNSFTLEKNNLGILLKNDTCEIRTHQLLWGNVNYSFPDNITPQVILGADIIFDDSVFIDLIKSIEMIFSKAKNHCVMYIGVTVRNQETFDKFIDMLGFYKFLNTNEYYIPPSNCLLWDESVPIRILRIHRSELKLK